MIQHTAFFGDGEKTFAFPTLDLIRELEAKTGHGIGAIHDCFRFGRFSLSDIEQVIRLGLIGGGTAPADAARLVSTYLVGRPWRENMDLAGDIIAALFYGTEDDAQDEKRQAAASGDLSAAINDALEQVPA
ncbi:gene transfer agent family protein [Shinella sp. S4-D37]|uniref:gene transfer agent family protein n=1 Tax=Shinella sp. S4-D37 TaxID=3161999 RepID=UPI003466B20A